MLRILLFEIVAIRNDVELQFDQWEGRMRGKPIDRQKFERVTRSINVLTI